MVEVKAVSKRILLVLVAAATAVTVAVPTAGAATKGLLSCGATSEPFAQFGDYAGYFGFANNGFENGASGWQLSNSSVGAGNEPWFVNGSGSSSLAIAPGGTASSPRVCTTLLAPDWRMFAHANGANGSLRAQIVFYGLLGNVTGILNLTNFSPSGYTSWEPTGEVPSLLSLPLLTTSAQLRLTNTGSTGAWQVDDVFVDPLGSRNAG
jgi:hypothetical protein